MSGGVERCCRAPVRLGATGTSTTGLLLLGARGRRPPALPYGVLVGADRHGGVSRQVVATGGRHRRGVARSSGRGASARRRARRQGGCGGGVVHTATCPTVALSQPGGAQKRRMNAAGGTTWLTWQAVGPGRYPSCTPTPPRGALRAGRTGGLDGGHARRGGGGGDAMQAKGAVRQATACRGGGGE